VAGLPAKPVIAVFMMAGFGSASLSDVTAARSRLVRTPAAAAHAELGGPVAVKIAAAIRKSDIGGVAPGSGSPRAAAAMASALGLCLGRAARRTPAGTR
jgi:hypothetical protein